MSDSSPEIRETLLTKKTLLAIVGALTIGIVASGLYDLLVRPGINYVADWSFTFISIFSETIENSPFSSAALDPTSLPSLLQMLFYTSVLPGIFLGAISVVVFVKVKERRSAETEEIKPTKNRKLKLTLLISIMVFYIIVIFILLNTFFSVISKAIAIHRVFNANIAICAPYISEREKTLLLSNFAKMETKQDYLVINKQLQKIAKANVTTLRKEEIK